jgi:hypothetical protein
MTIDAIRMYPMIIPSGYPDKYDVVERKMEKKLELERALLEQRKAQIDIENLAFEIYSKGREQDKIRLEIFQNRKLDIYV